MGRTKRQRDLGTLPENDLARDEEMARQLQAMDNGLRSRRRASTSESLDTMADIASSDLSTPKSRRKKRGSITVKSEESSSAREDHAAKDNLPLHCQGCGVLLVRPGSVDSDRQRTTFAERAVQPSSVNYLNCEECVVLYQLPPSAEGESHPKHPKASPSLRCSKCELGFLREEQLESHHQRVHS